ncbi:glutamine amidotransferase [Cavenderia fasciculata]|uniref:Glutamine amidotransferase n=1 Tax=Cavenderia fasciculata TaxID=261658 RepID=F4PHY7_CACFS|nr:glutamine amidotransferase [Cavenderia fasciculata]EGG24474.1 glutamine amidotransferase [Cavenderia fasciculata]|eukprot:XP_004362325.1 glutamine amidotransferase [Cavenderia fasciculata]
MKIAINHFSSLYINFIKGYGLFAEVDYKIYNAVNLEFPNEDEQNEFDGYLLTGSSANSYDNDNWIVKLRTHLQHLDKSDKKICGICFGHQALAHALGGQVTKSKLGWELGQVTVQLNNDGKKFINEMISLDKQTFLVDGADLSTLTDVDSIQVLQIHQDIVQVVPNDFIVIGSTSLTQAQGFVKKSPSNPSKYHILTFQGHPEFNVDYLTELIKEEAPPELIEPSIRSLTNNPDQMFMSKLAFNFFFRQK